MAWLCLRPEIQIMDLNQNGERDYQGEQTHTSNVDIEFCSVLLPEASFGL